MIVNKIMSKVVVTVEMDDSLRVVKDIFDKTNFHHVLVVEAGKLFGVISDRDLLKALSPALDTAAEIASDVATLNKVAHQILTRDPITLSPQADVYDAIAIFNKHNISCIPVVNKSYQIEGLISWRDILQLMENQLEQHQNKCF